MGNARVIVWAFQRSLSGVEPGFVEPLRGSDVLRTMGWNTSGKWVCYVHVRDLVYLDMNVNQKAILLTGIVTSPAGEDAMAKKPSFLVVLSIQALHRHAVKAD
jgi:hypothetical protein